MTRRQLKLWRSLLAGLLGMTGCGFATEATITDEVATPNILNREDGVEEDGNLLTTTEGLEREDDWTAPDADPFADDRAAAMAFRPEESATSQALSAPWAPISGGVACFYTLGDPHISEAHAPGMLSATVSLRCSAPVARMYARARLVRSGAGIASNSAEQFPPKFGRFNVNADAHCQSGLYHTEGFFSVTYKNGKTLTAQGRFPKTYDVRIGGRSWRANGAGVVPTEDRYPSAMAACIPSAHIGARYKSNNPRVQVRNIAVGPVTCTPGGTCRATCNYDFFAWGVWNKVNPGDFVETWNNITACPP